MNINEYDPCATKKGTPIYNITRKGAEIFYGVVYDDPAVSGFLINGNFFTFVNEQSEWEKVAIEEEIKSRAEGLVSRVKHELSNTSASIRDQIAAIVRTSV